MQYNKTKFLKLLKYDKRLKEKGKFLSEENHDQFLNLLTYKVLIFDHVQWAQRHRYFSLMKNFIDETIDVNKYINQLFELKYETEKVTDELKVNFGKLEDFEPNPLSKGFSKFTTELCSDCEVFKLDPALRDDYEISEEQ